jgi:hypothetical protein
MEQRTLAAVNGLLDSSEPAIRLMTRRDVLGQGDSGDAGLVLAGAKMTALLSGQHADGGFGVHPYRKWTGAHWRLISLVELAIPRWSRARSRPPGRCWPTSLGDAGTLW